MFQLKVQVRQRPVLDVIHVEEAYTSQCDDTIVGLVVFDLQDLVLNNIKRYYIMPDGLKESLQALCCS